jgi:diketogulonate reductase-like aldo/keto reductase
MALDAGFRAFDTAEADMWYNQDLVGKALASYFNEEVDDQCIMDDKEYCTNVCTQENLMVSTKIPPWELTSIDNIRLRAEESRKIVVGFCDDEILPKFPMDIYYIHAPECWEGWHPRCNGVKDTLSLREAWLGMEAVVGTDHNTKRIGLSNIWPNQLRDIIRFVKDREASYDGVGPPPRMPDVLQAYADPLKPSRELREICKENGIEFVSYSTLGTQHRTRDGTNPVLSNPQINEIAEKHGRSAAEVVLSWAIHNEMSVIPRSTNEHHIMQLSRLLNRKSFLHNEDLLAINALSLN